ncbi:MAG: IclR family transcriptional regulator [Lachnospiraceae bacterium]|nr:IclR family transcriptional regulator [Lachnospiraceae bacterium]
MGDNVRSVDRILDLMELLAEERSPVSLSELSKETALSKTTVFRLMSTLCNRGYAEKIDSEGYVLGPKMIELAGYHIENLELHTVARPFLADLYSEFKLTVHLGKLEKDKVVYIELMERKNLKNREESGLGVPAYTSSIGKCLLASMSGKELSDRLYRKPLKKYTSKTITDPEEYRKHLKTVRSNGWALDDEEYLKGRRCIGAPIYDFKGEAIACVSVSGNINELSDDRLPVIREAVIDTADAISLRMGYVK